MFQSVIKMSSKAELNQKTPCILEIGDKGIKMIDKSKPGVSNLFRNNILSNPQLLLMFQDGGGGVPSHEYFFSLKNVTFCGFHPRDHRYFGFITKVIRRYLIKKSQLFEIFLASTRRPVYRSTPVMCLSASPPPDVLLRPTGELSRDSIIF